jgi:hypothetical protein
VDKLGKQVIAGLGALVSDQAPHELPQFLAKAKEILDRRIQAQNHRAALLELAALSIGHASSSQITSDATGSANAATKSAEVPVASIASMCSVTISAMRAVS